MSNEKAPDQVELSGDPAEDAVAISNYIAMHLRKRDLAELFSAIGDVDPPLMAELLYKQAKTAKLSSCAYAKRYQDMVPG